MPTVYWTYATLLQALQDWPVHASPKYITNLPTIIGLGERRLWGDLNIEEYDKDDTSLSTTLGATALSKPSDCLVVRSLGLTVAGKFVGLEIRSADYCKNINSGAANGTPAYYAEVSTTTLLIAPPPAGAYTAVYRYMGTPAETLSSSSPNSSTWLSRVAPDALFAACLAESEEYIKADDRYQDYIGKYNNELLPRARAEVRNLIRAGDYQPIKPAAMVAG